MRGLGGSPPLGKLALKLSAAKTCFKHRPINWKTTTLTKDTKKLKALAGATFRTNWKYFRTNAELIFVLVLSLLFIYKVMLCFCKFTFLNTHPPANSEHDVNKSKASLLTPYLTVAACIIRAQPHAWFQKRYQECS